MSITLNIDNATAAQLERAARSSGVSLSELVTRLVRQSHDTALTGKSQAQSLPPTHDFGNPPDFDYRKAAAALDEEETVVCRGGNPKA